MSRVVARLTFIALWLCLHRANAESPEVDPLPSWNDTGPKQAIRTFVERVTTSGSPDFVPPAQRIATFDNDGTLWCEQPMYVQAAFVIDRVKELTPKHPEWRDREPFRSVLAGNTAIIVAASETASVEMLMATHAGNTVDEFETIVKQWFATARQPRFKRPYTQLVYQPMLELLAYLRAHEFKTFIVSGGGIEFMRAYADKAYGIPPEQTIGSSLKTQFEDEHGDLVIARLPKIDFIDDGPGKPVGINRFIGRRPIMAFGNSDGDLQMLEWTTAGKGARFGLIVHHTDAEREYAYDRDSKVGHLDKALGAAPKKGWTVVSMKDDWKQIFPTAD